MRRIIARINRHDPGIKELDLSFHGLFGKDLAQFVDALNSNPYIRSIILELNNIRNIEQLGQCKYIQRIDLSRNSVSEKDVLEFVTTAHPEMDLQDIDLRGNYLHGTLATRLLRARFPNCSVYLGDIRQEKKCDLMWQPINHRYLATQDERILVENLYLLQLADCDLHLLPNEILFIIFRLLIHH